MSDDPGLAETSAGWSAVRADASVNFLADEIHDEDRAATAEHA